MGLQINTQIGTLDGIATKAYVRITNYSISKFGSAEFRLELFKSIEDSQPAPDTQGQSTSMYGMSKTTQNNQIGNIFTVSLMSKVAKIVITSKPVSREVTYTNGQGELVTEIKDVMEDVEETIIVDAPDLTVLNDVSIFEFAYIKLNEKLQADFGTANVVNA